MVSSTKKILLVAATPGELRTIKQLWNAQASQYMKADFLQTGIGNIHTTLRLTQSLSQAHYDFVINIGVCGYKNSREPLIQIVRSIYAPTGKEICTPVFFEFAPLKSIYCSEVPITNPTILGDEHYGDMESYAVEKVCDFFSIPRLILKVPIDKIGAETLNFDYISACETLGKNIDMKQLKNSLETYLSALPQKYDITPYLPHYKLSVSEKIIFEKYFYKYITLGDGDFDAFFMAQKHREKTEFLQQLSSTLDTLSQL